MGESATDPGQPFDGGLGLGGGPRGMVAEIGFEGRRVRVESRGRNDVAELPDGVESAVAVGVEDALDARPRHVGEANDLRPRDAFGRQPQNLHPSLHLGRWVVEAVGSDLGDDRRREIERAHGVLPARWGGGSEYSRRGRSEKLNPGRQEYSRPLSV